MKIKFLLHLPVFFLLNSCQAQKQVTVKATYDMALPRNLSMEQLETRCTQEARIKAIREKFGTRNSQVTVNNVKEVNGAFSEEFESRITQQENAEWLKDLEEPVIKWIYGANSVSVEVTVKGIIQSFPDEGNVSLKIETASDESFGNPTTDFKSGASFYMNLIASSSGYVTVYYKSSDNNRVYRVLPKNSNTNMCEIAADKKYFACTNHQKTGSLLDSEGLSFYLGDKVNSQIDELIVIYSKKECSKPVLDKEVKDAKEEPFGLSFSEFTDWKLGLYKSSNQVTIKTIPISILN
jgi:hypothetical protein